jgi:FkbM family methyltransferase
LFQAVGYDIVAVPPGPVSRCRALGGHERFLRDLKLRGFAPTHILDVGANRGDWTRLALEVFPRASVTMVEPQEAFAPALAALARANPRLRAVRAAAGASNGEIALAVPRNFEDAATMMPMPASPGLEVATETVPLRTIADIVRESGLASPELVKLDIQGAEIEALKGAGAMLGAAEVFVCEATFFAEDQGPDFAALVAFMNHAGYVVFEFCGFLPRPSDGALGQADVVFVKRDGTFRKNPRWR